MVFESVVVDVLNRFLGDYVVNLDSSQLSLGIWGGAVALKNLEIKENALYQFDVPFKVKAGHIGKLNLQIPWKNLYTQPVEAVLDEVYLLIVPTASIKYDAEKEEKQQLETKQKELQRIEDAKQKIADKDKPGEKQDTFIEKLITQVIKNLQLKICNIHIRYEDDITNKDIPLSFGVSLQNLSLQTSDQSWNPCMQDETTKLFYKLVRLDNFFAYWNVKSEMFYHSSCNESLSRLKDGVARPNEIPEGYNFVFRPISAKAKLRMNPRSDVDFSAPKLDLDVNLQDIAVELNKPQYFSVMELLESIDMMNRNLPYRKYRPDVPVHNNAKKWWKYIMYGILEVNVQPKLHMWSWEHINYHRKQVKKYKDLYKAKITSKKPAEEILNMLEELEKVLDIFNITLARQQAEVEATKARLKIFRPGAKQDDADSDGWFSWVWGWGRGSSNKSLQEPKGLEQLMTPQEKDKLYAAIGYSETAADPTLPKTYEAIKLCVKLLSMTISIRGEKEKSELIKLALIDLCTTVTQRPGAEAIRFESSVSAFEVQGMAQGKTIPCLLSSRTVHSANNASLFTIMFETNPLNESANQKIRIESQPLEIIYDAMTVNSLVDFFKPPNDVHLEQLTSATLLKLEEFREKTATGLVYVIETQKILDLNINLMASYVIVPQKGFYEPASDILLLDLGHLKMTSKSRSTLSDIRVGESALEDIMSRAYDKFDIQLSSIQLLYSRHYENWEEARNLRSSSQHILQPLDVKMELGRAMVVTDARMPKYKLSGELPLLSFNISDEKLKCILKLIDSIPKPESPSDATPALQPSQLQIPSLLATPQLSTVVAPFLEPHSIAGSSESEEEFYDAPSSPVEDLPFFEAPLGSFKRTGNVQKTKVRRESLKNMTDFQLRFEISELFVQVCHLTKGTEKPILRLEILKLGTELKLQTYDMTATVFLREIGLMCPEYVDDKDKPVYIISTLDNLVDDLLAIEYVKADINAPELKTTYKNVLQLIKVTFSSVDIHLHTEALLNTINFLNNLLPKQPAVLTASETVQEKEEKREVLKKLTSKKSKYEDVCDLHICADLSCLRIFIREQKRRIAEISIEGLDSQMMMMKQTTEISAKLKNIIIVDCDEAALYKKALYITGKEVFSFKMVTYMYGTDGVAYTNMNAVDSRVYLTVGCIQIVFVNKFVSAILAFVNNFQTAKEAITEATVQAAEKAASGVKELAQQSSRMALDINIKAPVVIIPQSATSTDVLVADFGLITINNEFLLVKTKVRYNLPPILDDIHVKLSELKLYRSSMVSNSLQKEIQLLQPLNLEVTVERNLAALWYHEIPDIKISGHLKPMNLILSQEDITTILRTLHENLGDNPVPPHPPPEDTEITCNVPVRDSQVYGAGVTVITSAVVETHSSKVKTALTLDFQIDSLTLVLYSPNSNQPPVLDQRDVLLKLAEFKLLLISTAAKMLSDGSMNASVKLTNCTLDDKRQTVEKATPRMIGMKRGSEKKVMLDIIYKQGRDGSTVIDTFVQEIYLCASIEFLLTVADIFLKATAESAAAQSNFMQTLAGNDQGTQDDKQPESTMEINVVVKNPDIVLVADLTRSDAPALVLTAQCEVSMKNGPQISQMTAAVKGIEMKACPFLPDARKGNVTTILQPCDLLFDMLQLGTEPQKADLSIKSIRIKVSPIMLNTVISITSALFPTKETAEKDISPVPPDLWDKKDIKTLSMWFLEEPSENKSPTTVTELIPTGETLQMSIESVVITLEAGVGHKTVPMLSAKSSFSGEVRNWSTLINISSRLELEVHYYNEMLGVWEPLLEPLEIEGSDNFRPWVLGMKMKKKAKTALVEVVEEENYKVPEYKTVINIYSQDQLNITLSKCGLLMLSNLGTAFAEAASQTSEVFKKDRAPFVLINSLGVPTVVLPSDFFSVLNIDPKTKPYVLEDGQSLSMEYIESNEQDQFTAMTTLNSKVFYIWLTPENHSTTDKIPLTKVGRSLNRVRHNYSGVVRSIVCQIDTIEGSRIITVRSPIQIKNHFSIPLHIFEDGKCLGTASPDNEFNIPLTSYRSLLFFRPATDENSISEEYASSEGVSFDEMVKNFDKLLQKKCQPIKPADHPLIINIVPMQDTLISSMCTDDQWDLPYVVHLWPSVLLRNLLPYQIAYSLEGHSTTCSTLEEGCSAQIHNAILDQSKLELRLLNYLDKNWTSEYYIRSNQQEIGFLTFTCVTDLDREDLDIAVHVTYATGQMIIAIHSPYWMVNKTGRLLQYKADGIHRKHPPDYKMPLLFSFQPKYFYQNNKVQLMVTDSELSDHFSLDTVGSHGCVKCKTQKNEYQVGVTINNSSFNITRIVTFTPFFMITNRSKHILEVAEEGNEKWISLALQQCTPFWPENNESKLCVRVENSDIPLKRIQLDQHENCLLLHLDNRLGGIIVDITVAEHSTVITFSDYHDGAAPFLIINNTKVDMIEYGQSSLCVMEDTLQPNKAVLYAWGDPVGSKKLTWKCGKNSGEVTQKDDLITSIEVGSKKIYLLSFFEGLQRIILFTEEEKVFNVMCESEKVELAEQEIIISLQDVGISLVNNCSKQEVGYIGITSSDVIWESKPKKKSRWRPLSVKQTETLEKEFKEYCDLSPTENKIIELDPDIPVCLTPTGNNMKILQPNEIPVRRSFLPALKVQYSTSEHQTSFRVQIYWIQIQNQITGAIFPFVFYPIKLPKSIALDSEPKPFTDVSIVMRTAGHSQISRIKYFKVLIQEMDLRLDLGFLYALADFFTFADGVPKDQEIELFKKDVEAVQEELKDISSTDTSQISLYEYFHISPIKLHLSFSLSTGREDSNKERRNDLIPVQSLNLLLKSIGATLTDVQDVVLKLAFFELNYHFCTTQQLQWAVIMHYSKQAIKQMYVLILGLDVLGNPFGFIRDLSEGVEAFFYEPYQGAIQGPEEFVEGMALGLKALVGGAVGGLAGAASRITGAMAKGVAAITMDEDYQQKRREVMNKQPTGIKEGITRGGKGLMSGFVSGITGIVTKPIRGAQKEGAAGFFKGVGKGLVGAVARPTGGIIDMASSTFQGIKRATNTSEDVTSLRPPRFFGEDGVIRPYRLRDGAGSQMLQNIENGRFAKLRYFTHAMVNKSDLLMVTKSGILFVTRGTFGQLTCEWQYTYDEFTKEPFIVDGRRLRIEAKERVKSVFHAKEFGKIINFKTSDDAKWVLSKLEEVRESHTTI